MSVYESSRLQETLLVLEDCLKDQFIDGEFLNKILKRIKEIEYLLQSKLTCKVAYNNCFGRFSISKIAAKRLIELGVEDEDMQESLNYAEERGYNSVSVSIDRHNSKLIQVIEELGDEANGEHASLEIAEIAGNLYRISEYDGNESVITPEDQEWIMIDIHT